MTATIQDSIVREIVVRAPQEKVYRAITDPEQLPLWFPDGVEGKIEVGSRPIFDFGEYGKNSIYIVAADPHSYFAYNWVPGSAQMGVYDDVLEAPHTLCEFRLETVPDGTLVRLTESGFASLPSEFYERAMKDNSGGWTVMMHRLKTFVETGTAVSPK